MTQNIHKQAIPAEVREQIETKSREIKNLIAPYLIALTASDRRNLPKMGEKSVAFVEKAYQFFLENPSLRPNFIDEADYTADYRDAMDLRVAATNIAQANDTLDDLLLIAGSEAYQASLGVYANLAVQAERNIGNAKTLYAELRKRFPRRRRGGETLDETGDA
ncbi:MAG: hypothetical protein LBL48_08730 [Azoarcus sp.]|nr:hypothetical protein [Azoarcus sp.]